MAWLAVDKNGVETISPQKPERDFNEWSCYLLVWIDGEAGDIDFSINLPKGTVSKIIGRELTWADEPVEIDGE